MGNSILRILVTGSSGYIGSNLINEYKYKYKFEKFSLLTQQIDGILFDDLDIVFHSAALVHQKTEHEYKKYHEINVEYSILLAKSAKENGIKQFVFLSTIAVYGEDTKKLDEDTACNPVNFYGKSKFEAEKRLLALNDDNFIVTIIRPPMVYGNNAPGNIDSLVKLVKKVPIIPLGKIDNKRSFIYIGNLCHLVDVLIQQKKSGVFLASDDNPLGTSKLIQLIAKNLDKKIYLIKIPFFETLLKLVKPSFYKRLYGSLEVDNTITRKKLNLVNPYSIEEGIKLMIKGEET